MWASLVDRIFFDLSQALREDNQQSDVNKFFGNLLTAQTQKVQALENLTDATQLQDSAKQVFEESAKIAPTGKDYLVQLWRSAHKADGPLFENVAFKQSKTDFEAAVSKLGYNKNAKAFSTAYKEFGEAHSHSQLLLNTIGRNLTNPIWLLASALVLGFTYLIFQQILPNLSKLDRFILDIIPVSYTHLTLPTICSV